MKKQLILVISLLAISSLGCQARHHVGFSFGFGSPGFGFGLSTMAPMPCFAPAPVIVHPCHHYAPVVPSVGFSVNIPVVRNPWRISNETDDIVEISSGNQSWIIKPGRTKRIPRISSKLTVFAACNGEEVTIKPGYRTFSIAENIHGDLVFQA